MISVRIGIYNTILFVCGIEDFDATFGAPTYRCILPLRRLKCLDGATKFARITLAEALQLRTIVLLSGDCNLLALR